MSSRGPSNTNAVRHKKIRSKKFFSWRRWALPHRPGSSSTLKVAEQISHLRTVPSKSYLKPASHSSAGLRAVGGGDQACHARL